jgi:hypothetical protein
MLTQITVVDGQTTSNRGCNFRARHLLSHTEAENLPLNLKSIT